VIAELPVEAEIIPSKSGRGGRILIANPLQDPEWDLLLATRPDATFFHGKAWARVLHDTYGHAPVYFYRLDGNCLGELLPLMEVSSPVTGRRGVSLPFTDFCVPLTSPSARTADLYETASEHGRARGWRYLQCRHHDGSWAGSSPSLSFYGHVLDLSADEKALFAGMESTVRRGIRKAESGGVSVTMENSVEAVKIYYVLHCRTRQRHGVPPQPFRFFANIQKHVLQPGLGFIAIARVGEKPVASAIFFHHGGLALYKYGASNLDFQQLRPNNLLMWEGIRQCRARGCARLHFGRTSLFHDGLRRFKLGFGARETEIKYSKYDFREERFVTDVDRVEGWFNRVFSAMPPALLRLAGQMLYPHLS
jgi:hypothetical protein